MGHLGQMTQESPQKFGFDWPRVSEKMFENVNLTGDIIYAFEMLSYRNNLLNMEQNA